MFRTFSFYNNNFDENKHEKYRISIPGKFVFQGFKVETPISTESLISFKNRCYFSKKFQNIYSLDIIFLIDF